MSAVMFTLLFGLLSGIAAFVGSAPFETVLMLGLLGLMHLSVVAARKADDDDRPGKYPKITAARGGDALCRRDADRRHRRLEPARARHSARKRI